MRIQDIENRTQMERATIRFYERQGMIKPVRNENGYRDYSEEEVNQLLRIKLLRQLDFPLEKIQELQQGRIHLSEAISQQSLFLKSKADAALQASELCLKILTDGCEYNTLDADYYVNLQKDTSQKNKFREHIQSESHPVRRFIARHIDWTVIHLLFLYIVFGVFRVRPMLDFYLLLVMIAAVISGIFLEALLTYLFGCTLGKWIMGIRVESANGGKITWEETLWRAKLVTQEGVGFRIPIWSVIRCYLGYKACLEGKSLSWEEDTELHFKSWNLKGKIALVLVSMLLVTSCSALGLDISFYPTYRSNKINMEQFISNYNGYAREGKRRNNLERAPYMTEQGQFEILSRIKVDYIRQDPTYLCNDAGYLEQIKFTGNMEYDQEVIEYMILAVAGAQKDAELLELASLKAGTTLNQEIRRPIFLDSTSGEFKVAGIHVLWSLDSITKYVTIIIQAATQ